MPPASGRSKQRGYSLSKENIFVKTDRMQEFPVRVTGKLHDPKTSVSAGTAILYAVTSLTHGIFELLGGVMEGTWNLFR